MTERSIAAKRTSAEREIRQCWWRTAGHWWKIPDGSRNTAICKPSFKAHGNGTKRIRTVLRFAYFPAGAREASRRLLQRSADEIKSREKNEMGSIVNDI
ncbi:hypothetical protein PO124_28555 [Bacillus licheniformis]|nr:hypothetical protein [Bacillus licheniformis]